MRTIRLLYKTRLIFYATLLIIFYNEFLIYWLSYLNWPGIAVSSTTKTAKNNNNNDIRILLVADPQLIGDNDEAWYLSSIAKWDSDRYLQNTYRLALSYTKPDLIIFLGDLFDEGLKATDEQFNGYYKRFKNIFKIDSILEKKSSKLMFISGDNDIGGEYHGDRSVKLDKRFESYFGPLIQLNQFKYLNFLQLDLDKSASFYTKKMQDKVKNLINSRSSRSTNEYMIILNHMSILRRYKDEVSKIADDTNVGLVIKGDDHKFYIAKYSSLSNEVESFITYSKNSTNFYALNLQTMNSQKNINSFYELSIPTCSYRMGVPDMGYGLMTITQNGNAFVSILWLPSRFKCIYLYLIFILIVFFMIFMRFFFNFIFFKLRNSTFLYDWVFQHEVISRLLNLINFLLLEWNKDCIIILILTFFFFKNDCFE